MLRAIIRRSLLETKSSFIDSAQRWMRKCEKTTWQEKLLTEYKSQEKRPGF